MRGASFANECRIAPETIARLRRTAGGSSRGMVTCIKNSPGVNSLGNQPFNKTCQGRCLIRVEWHEGNVTLPRNEDVGKRCKQVSRCQVGLKDRQWADAKPES